MSASCPHGMTHSKHVVPEVNKEGFLYKLFSYQNFLNTSSSRITVKSENKEVKFLQMSFQTVQVYIIY